MKYVEYVEYVKYVEISTFCARTASQHIQHKGTHMHHLTRPDKDYKMDNLTQHDAGITSPALTGHQSRRTPCNTLTNPPR